jgi:hypothetical protein
MMPLSWRIPHVAQLAEDFPRRDTVGNHGNQDHVTISHPVASVRKRVL